VHRSPDPVSAPAQASFQARPCELLMDILKYTNEIPKNYTLQGYLTPEPRPLSFPPS